MTKKPAKIVRGVICSEDLFSLNPSEDAISDSFDPRHSVNLLVNLIEFSNSYVLNDTTVISTSEGINDEGLLTPLLRDELANGDGLELAKHFSPQRREEDFNEKRFAKYGLKTFGSSWN